MISSTASAPTFDASVWFRLPPKSSVAAFAEAQVRLFRHDESFQDYFQPLQLYFGQNGATTKLSRSFSERLLSASLAAGHGIARTFGRRKLKVDVLLCPMPYFLRRTENQLLLRMIAGLAKTNATVLCLLPESAPIRGEIESWLKAEKRWGQVTLMDLEKVSHPLLTRLSAKVARSRGRAIFGEVVDILQPLGLAPGQAAMQAFIDRAVFAEAWRNIEDQVDFDALVSRCHWQQLCSPVCRTARQRGKAAITFQQGVVGHTLDVPVTTSKYVTFGNSSARFLAAMNQSFYRAVGATAPPVEYSPGGCLFDKVLALPDQFSKRTLLIFDEPVGAHDFYGITSQREALFVLVEKLLGSSPLLRLIVRPHPYWDTVGLEGWKDIIRKHPDRAELSHAAWTLEDDLQRSSVVVGISSGALTVAAASGLPTFFLVTEPGYVTEDLACFRPGQFVGPDLALHEIARVVNDADAFAEARATALRNARDYYADGRNLELNAGFFERLLRAEPSKVVASATANT
jgi:hypothetical protein